MSLYMTVEMEKLVNLAKEGNIGAMRTLYDNHRVRILNLGFSYARNREDAEEILQETFAKAFMALQKNKLKENKSFPSWLYRIGINASLDLVKKRGKIKLENLESSLNLQGDTLTETTPEEITLREEISQKITEAVECLSPKQRMIFTMKHYQHLKIREIAQYMQCSEGNVKKQLFRAVHMLKRELKPHLREASHEM